MNFEVIYNLKDAIYTTFGPVAHADKSDWPTYEGRMALIHKHQYSNDYCSVAF